MSFNFFKKQIFFLAKHYKKKELFDVSRCIIFIDAILEERKLSFLNYYKKMDLLFSDRISDLVGQQKSGSIRVSKKSGFFPGFPGFRYKSNQNSGRVGVRVPDYITRCNQKEHLIEKLTIFKLNLENREFVFFSNMTDF